MKITSPLSNVTNENPRLQLLFDKFVKPNPKIKFGSNKGVMDFETLKIIIFGDPDTKIPQGFKKEEATFEQMSKVKVGKYVQWMLKNFIQPKLEYVIGTPEYTRASQEYKRLFIEDIDKLNINLLKFERFKHRLPPKERDINYHTLETLSLAVDDFKLSKDSKSAKEERITKENPYQYYGSTIEIVTPNWTIVKISENNQEGKNAAAYFGGYYDLADEFNETNWCTSKLDGSYYSTYLKDGPLYVVLPNDNKGQVGKKTGLPKERYQFHFPSNQYMNRRDKPIKLIHFLNEEGSELKEYFKPEFAKGLVQKGGDKADIIYPDSSSGKFIALYGFNDLFASLPENIKHLFVKNKSTENISLDVPESIMRFKNLEALHLQNIVESLPETIGDLKNLKFIALTDNNELKIIPESISKLHNLRFINLKGSPNAKIPESIKERIENEDEISSGFFYLKTYFDI